MHTHIHPYTHTHSKKQFQISTTPASREIIEELFKAMNKKKTTVK